MQVTHTECNNTPREKLVLLVLLLQTEHPRHATDHRHITILLIQAGKHYGFMIDSTKI
jgi:hypothetical protein